ncbi:MAG: molybdopterin converting factor subunit 1 [Rickettsiales bacterium]|nr:molybdopterin converting factor subunit 1 [Rickettsiales bacterium]
MKILYFANLRDVIGKSEEYFTIENEMSISDLITLLKKKNKKYITAFDNKKKLMYAVNCEYVRSSKRVSDKDEVAFFPPVTGG